MRQSKLLAALAAFNLLTGPALAGSGTITVLDATSVSHTYDVVTDGTGNFVSKGVICDQAAAAACASVGTAGAPSTNALTIQAVTLGHGTAANAIRVELPTDGTGLVSAAQSGTWTVQPGNTANTTPWLVTATQSGAWNITNITGTVSLPTGAATSANQSTEISSLATIATNTGAAVPSGTNLIGNVGQVYPAGSTPITASATGTTAATTATLAANATLHTYICGFSIRANATAAATGNATVTGMVTGTTNYTQWTAPLASGVGIVEEIYQPCIISSAINTAIAVVSAAPGTGGVVSVTAWGFQL